MMSKLTGCTIKKDNHDHFKLPELGKLEACATSPVADKFTLLSLDQLTDAYSVTMRLVEMTKHFKRFDLRDVLSRVKTNCECYQW